MATAIPKTCLGSSAIRCRDVETGPNLGVLAVFPSNGATCRCPLALVHDSKLTVNDPNPEASHRPILYDSGRPSSVRHCQTN